MPSIPFEIKDGNVSNKALLWESVKRFFVTLKSDGKYIWPMPEKETKIRSAQQNRYYWGVVCKLISDHTGYTSDEVHQILTKEFLSYDKPKHRFVLSTSKLKTAEFEAYMEDCRRFAAEKAQVYIPLPNEPDNYFYDL